MTDRIGGRFVTLCLSFPGHDVEKIRVEEHLYDFFLQMTGELIQHKSSFSCRSGCCMFCHRINVADVKVSQNSTPCDLLRPNLTFRTYVGYNLYYGILQAYADRHDMLCCDSSWRVFVHPYPWLCKELWTTLRTDNYEDSTTREAAGLRELYITTQHTAHVKKRMASEKSVAERAPLPLALQQTLYSWLDPFTPVKR